MKNGRPPRRILFHGPTGPGKTTSARIVARYFFCRNPVGIGDPCDRCPACTKDLSDFFYYDEWTGNEVTRAWKWWEENMSTLFDKPHVVIFIDEAQELEKGHQAEFRAAPGGRPGRW